MTSAAVARFGPFSRHAWLHHLGDSGFETTTFREETTEDRTPRDVFVGQRPAG